jgi:hypothetical protein
MILEEIWNSAEKPVVHELDGKVGQVVGLAEVNVEPVGPVLARVECVTGVGYGDDNLDLSASVQSSATVRNAAMLP